MKSSLITLSLIAVIIPKAMAIHLEVNGMGRVRTFVVDNYDMRNKANDEDHYSNYRFQVGVKAALEQDSPTWILLQPRFNKTAGQENHWDIHQAYIHHSINPGFELLSGRQELAYGDELLIGAGRWSDTGRSFDGNKIRLSWQQSWLDFFATTLTETRTDTKNGDHEFNGVYYSTQIGPKAEWDLYILNKQDFSEQSQGQRKIVNSAGTRYKAQWPWLNFRYEVTSQNVKINNTHESAYQYHLELARKLNEFLLAIEHSYASEYYDQLHPAAHKWLGAMDLFRKQNIKQNAFHISYLPQNQKYNATISIHQFEAIESESGAHNWLAPNVTSDNSQLGQEIDFTLNYQTQSKLRLQTVLARFSPGEFYRKSALPDAVNYSYLQLQIDF